MDLLSHAVAGASVGLAFGNPWLGAVIGIAPDFVLGPKRRTLPTTLYNATHSLLSVTAIGLYIWVVFDSVIPLLALLSHLLLDIPTHGKEWAPTLLYPLSEKRYSYGEEWEWFNRSWIIGLCMTIMWSAIWFALAYRGIG